MGNINVAESAVSNRRYAPTRSERAHRMAQQKANGTAEGEWRPDLLDDLSEKMSDAFWVWNASEYDIVAVTAFEAGF